MEADRTLTGHEEGVVLVSGRMLLRLEQGVKVPEGTLNEVVGGHLAEAEEERGGGYFILWQYEIRRE